MRSSPAVGFLGRRFPAAKPGRRRKRGFVAFLTFVVGSAIVGVVVGLCAAPAATGAGLGALRTVDEWDAMTVDVPFDAALPQRSVMLDRNGKSYAVLFAENRVPLTRSQISPKFVDALLSIEDDRFYTHGGVDLIGTTRAIGNNLLGGRRQGASTITQQWIKNLLLAAADTPERRAAADDVSSRPPRAASAGWLSSSRISLKPRTKRRVSSASPRKFGSIIYCSQLSSLLRRATRTICPL